MQTEVVVEARQWREVYDPRIFIPLLAATVFCFVYILTQAQGTIPIRTTTANQQTKTTNVAISGTPQITISNPSSLPTISTNVSSSTDLSASTANTFSPQPSGNSGVQNLDSSGSVKSDSSNSSQAGLSDFQNFVFNIMNQAGKTVKQSKRSIH